MASTALILTIGGLNVHAAAFNSFAGGVTGVPGAGTTWGSYYPKGKSVYVTAKGKTTKTVTARSLGSAYAQVNRAVSGNKSYWGSL